MPSSATRPVDLLSSESKSKHMQHPALKWRRTQKLLWRKAERGATDEGSETDGRAEECLLVEPRGTEEESKHSDRRQKSKKTTTVITPSLSSNEDDVVPGMPKGRMWMKEVRVPSRTSKTIPIRASQPPVKKSKQFQQSSLLDHFAKKQPHTKVISPARPPYFAVMVAQRRNAQPKAPISQEQNTDSTSTRSSSSTPMTSPGALPQESSMSASPSMRPVRKAVQRGMAKRAAIAAEDINDEVDTDSEFQASQEDTDQSSEPSSMEIDTDLPSEEGGTEEESDRPQPRKASSKLIEKVKPAATKKTVKKSRRDNSNAEARPAQDNYGSALDQTLPPISDISDIFLDLTGKALRATEGGPVLVKSKAKGQKPATVTHDLNDVLKHINGRKLRVATMCSGTESPILALQLINDALKPLGKKLEIEHLFSAEIVPHKQAYIERNFAPPVIFRDITEISTKDLFEATTAYGARAKIPGDVDLLVTGFSCVDHSQLNVNKKDMKEMADIEESKKKEDTSESKKAGKSPSESGDTMHAMLDYIERFRPKMVVIENVIGAPWPKLGIYLDAQRYSSQYSRCDTKKYYIPHTRQRGYMFCVDRDRFTDTKAAEDAVAQWGALMVKFQRPASSPVEDFLLNENDSRLILGRQELESARAEKAQRKAVDWRKCQTRHSLERLELSLGQKRPITNWVEGGLCKGPDYMWGPWVTVQVPRVWDTMEINFLRTYLSRGFDNQYKARIIDLSQNVDRNTDAGKSGVTSCLTPSGIPFSTLRGGPVLGIESLALQGLPIDKLLLTQETQAKLQDLAGNAMTSTVVGAAIASALISAFKILPRGSSNVLDTPIATEDPNVYPVHDLQDVKHGLGDYKPLAVDIACDEAARSARLCSCEDNLGIAEAPIQECRDCKHTICKSCGDNPVHNYEPRGAIRRISPADFQAKITAALPMKLTLIGLSSDTMEELEICIQQVSTLNKSQKQATKEAFRLALKSELRFKSQPDRTEIWTFSYDSQHAHMKIIISKKQVEWQLFAKAPDKEPVNSPVRKLLENPISRMIAAGSDLTKGNWEFRLPVTHKFIATVEGRGPLVPSYGHGIGLGPFQGSKVFSEYSISVGKELNNTVRNEIGGIYKLLPNCGTASGALHIQTGTTSATRPIFMFLDPDRLGKPSNDSFVFSEDKRRLIKGNRSIIARIDSTWRPDILIEGMTSQGLKKISKLEIWERGKGAMQTHEAHFADYIGGVKRVEFHVDGKWIKLPQAKLDVGNDRGVFLRADSSFKLAGGPGSCQAAHVILRCQAQVQQGELSSWKKWKVIDKVNEIPFFTSFAWLTEKVQHFTELSHWQEISQSSSQHCLNCAPSPPRILWRPGKDGKLVPFEHHNDADTFERSLRTRPWPMVPEIQVGDNGEILLAVSINPETLMHMAAYNIRTSPSDHIIMNWRLVTNQNGFAGTSFPKLTLKSNKDGTEADQPPSFKNHKLRPDQLRSLNWMKDQEQKPQIFVEEEVEERVVSQLGWRLEGRATKMITVRGGVLADHVGFGKTATILALIDTHREKDAVTSKTLVSGRISVKATLILVPAHLTEQWASEVEKFLCGQHKYKVLVISKIGDLTKQSIAAFQAADIIIVSWKICEHEEYLFKVAQFTGRDELPSKWSDRAGSTWYKRALSEISPHVDELKKGGRNLVQMIATKLQDSQKELADAEAESFVPSKRLTGAKYREFKLQNAQKKRKRDEGDELDDDECNTPAAKPTKRETAKKRSDGFKLASIASGALDWTNMRSPLLEIFEFSRVVVDEYTYATGNGGMVIPNLRGRARWILSGTPPMEDFADVKTISKFVGINLGVDDMTPGVTKALNSRKLAKDLTSSEKFQSYKVAHSQPWHTNRLDVAQRFLDQFVRQNPVDYKSIPASSHWMTLSLPAAERAVYLELQSSIAAIGGQLPNDTEDHHNDRDRRIQDCCQKSSTAGEALIKSASHFTVNDTNMNFPSAVSVLQYLIKIRKSQYSTICADFQAKAAKNKAVQVALKEECPQYDASARSIKTLGAGDKVAALEMKRLYLEVTGKPENSSLLRPKDRITVKNLRELVNNLDKVRDNMVKAIRGLRFLESVLSFVGEEILCGVCGTAGLSPEDASVLVTCGHIICHTCLMGDATGNADESCRVPSCLGNSTSHQIIPASEFLHCHNTTTSTSYSGKKLENVVDLINKIPKGEQVLIFVQYVDVIEKVGQALKRQNISYATLNDTDDSARVLRKFQTDKSASQSRVLILNIGNESASGSNLTNANHVIFLSPYHTISAQAYQQAMVQAEARARRHGQIKHVHIYHFITLKTIDVDIVETRKEMILTRGVPQTRGFEAPYKGFMPSGFGMVGRGNKFDTQGIFRSESSTCVDVDYDILDYEV